MKSDILVSQLSAKIFPSGNGIPISDDALYKLYISKVLLPTSNAAFVITAKSDEFVKFIGANFNVADKDQITLLQSIADIRGYVAKAQGDLKKDAGNAVAQKVDAATKDAAAATIDKANALSETAAKATDVKTSRDAVAAAVPAVADKAKDATVSDAEVVKLANEKATTPEAKAVVANVETSSAEKAAADAKVVVADQKIQATQLILKNALSLQSTINSPGFETPKSPTSSISAVLVPAN